MNIFSRKLMIDEDWLNVSPLWDQDHLDLLQKDVSTVDISALNSNIQEICSNSDKFPLTFPTNGAQCKTLVSTVNLSILDRNINSTYPLIHETALLLCTKFLYIKQRNGTDIEKNIYNNMSLKGFIERLLTKKAAVFIDPPYEYYLPDGFQGSGNWETIGTDLEVPPLVLANCLSYDELKLSCFISISCYSYFINVGSRSSRGRVEENRENIQPEGVVVSLVGPKLVMSDLYEFQDIISSKSNRVCNRNEIRDLFSNFYHDTNNKNITKIRLNAEFNNNVYKKRLAISFDTFLLEANARAKEKKTTAYVHLVGIGLGVWCISSHQEQVFVEALAERLRIFGNRISHISDLHLSYFNKTEHCGNISNGNIFPVPNHPTGIKIHISKREPFTKLCDSEKLLVVSYAADGNSLPGNEFWKGFLGNSGDSATTSASQIAELQNPHINPLVSVNNLRIITVEGSFKTLSEYVICNV